MILLAICLDCRLRLVVGISATCNGKLMTLLPAKNLSARTPRAYSPRVLPVRAYRQANQATCMRNNLRASFSRCPRMRERVGRFRLAVPDRETNETHHRDFLFRKEDFFLIVYLNRAMFWWFDFVSRNYKKKNGELKFSLTQCSPQSLRINKSNTGNPA